MLKMLNPAMPILFFLLTWILIHLSSAVYNKVDEKHVLDLVQLTPTLKRAVDRLLDLNLVKEDGPNANLYLETVFEHFYHELISHNDGHRGTTSAVPYFLFDLRLLPFIIANQERSMMLAFNGRWKQYQASHDQPAPIADHTITVEAPLRELFWERHLLGPRPRTTILYSTLIGEILSFLTTEQYNRKIQKKNRRMDHYWTHGDLNRKRALKFKLIFGLTVFADFRRRLEAVNSGSDNGTAGPSSAGGKRKHSGDPVEEGPPIQRPRVIVGEVKKESSLFGTGLAVVFIIGLLFGLILYICCMTRSRAIGAPTAASLEGGIAGASSTSVHSSLGTSS